MNPEVHHLTSFSWVSQTMTKLSLDPNQQRAVHMTACFSKPGIYNINRLAVFVTHNRDSSEMVLQKHLAPSVVVLQDVSAEWTSALTPKEQDQSSTSGTSQIPRFIRLTDFDNLVWITICTLKVWKLQKENQFKTSKPNGHVISKVWCVF